MKCVIFPGQGSQHSGMGKDLFDLFPQYLVIYEQFFGYSLRELCLNDTKGLLKQTDYTQPALYTVNYLSYLKYLQDNDTPDFLAGHSLGEYNALLAAGVFSFETGLRIVKKRGELMAQAPEGGMAAVINMSVDKITELLTENKISEIEIANINTPSQIVVSGNKKAILEYEKLFSSNGARYIVLPVGGAFHSSLMNSSGREFLTFLDGFEFNAPQIPVMSNITARNYPDKHIGKVLSDQITNNVKWCESIHYAMYKGVNDFIEVGPGKVLTGMVQKIKSEIDVINNVFGVFEQEEEMQRVSNNNTSQIEAVHVEVKNVDTGKSVTITPEMLGSSILRERYNLTYAYMSGSMYRGIASKEMVVAMGTHGYIGYLGTGGMSLAWVHENIGYIKSQLQGKPFGVNLLHKEDESGYENEMIELLIENGVTNIEASAFINITEALVYYRLKGLFKTADGRLLVNHHILAKVSRPEIAEAFLKPAPHEIVDSLLRQGKISQEQAVLGQDIPIAGELCVEADSGGHTDGGNLSVILPSILYLKNSISKEYNYKQEILIGAAGGIGTPSSAAAAFILGADFILTGSINQCTVEANISEVVKDMLEDMDVQDTAYAPAGDMFEMGAKVQVLKKGVLFPYRANKLYDLYKEHKNIDEIDQVTKEQLESRFFKKTIPAIWDDVVEFFQENNIDELSLAERSPKHKMALIFKWYFNYTTKLALNGDVTDKVNLQVHCGPALGAFNQWVKNTELHSWRNRNVNSIADKLLQETCNLLTKQLATYALL